MRNVGTVDRVVRILMAVVVAVLGITRVVSGPLLVVLGIVGVALLVTGIIGFCPLYRLVGLKTRKS